MARSSKEAQARYRERHRDEIRVKAREYAAVKRRSAGMPALGTPESTENRRRARKLSGPAHPNWKGDDVGYFALHAWINRHVSKTGICTRCGAHPKTRTDWANISGDYRRDLNDYIELCVPCHKTMDLRRRSLG